MTADAIEDDVVQFPVLRVNKQHILRFDSQRQLELMSQRFFDEGGFKEHAFFIDAMGYQYDLLDCRRIRRSANPLHWFRPSPAIIVKLSLGPPRRRSLAEVKKIVVDLVVSNAWYRQGHQTEKQFRAMIDESTSVEELMRKISFYGKWQG